MADSNKKFSSSLRLAAPVVLTDGSAGMSLRFLAPGLGAASIWRGKTITQILDF
jgi:hypothetical protein